MKARAGTGWQYVMTDLSLILFMITAAALRDTPSAGPVRTAPAVPAEGEPAALWRSGAGSPPIAAWLADAGRDPRLRLTIYASPAGVEAALRLAGEGGRAARIVLDPDLTAAPYAALTFDRTVARPLQPAAARQPVPEPSP